MNVGHLDYGCYGFRFFDEMPEPAVQMESVGMELRETREYYFDGMLRKERNRFLFQYTISGSGMFINKGKSHIMEPGQAFLARIPGEHVYFLPDTGSSWKFIFIMIYGTEVEKYWDRIISSLGSVAAFPGTAAVIRLLPNRYYTAAG